MARTVEQIQEAIKSDWMANTTLVEAYSLDVSKTFDEQFSKMSVERNLVYVFALAVYFFERVLDTFKADVQATVDSNALCSVPWLYARCLEFQLGDSLVFNDSTFRFEYETTDEAKRIVKFVAIREVQVEGVTKLRVYVSKANKVPLTSDELLAFTAYIKRIGAAGIHYEFISLAATELSFALNVVYDPMVLTNSGTKLSDGTKTVENAIQSYLDGITYGGVFNRTYLIDAVQKAEGVIDVTLADVKIGSGSGEVDNSQNIEAPGGCYSHKLDRSTINYSANVY